MILLTIAVSILSIMLYRNTTNNDIENDQVKITEIECRCDGEEERWTRLLDRLFEQKCKAVHVPMPNNGEENEEDNDLIDYGKPYEYSKKYSENSREENARETNARETNTRETNARETNAREENASFPIPPATISSNNKSNNLYGSALQYDPNDY